MLGKEPGLPVEPFWTVGKIASGCVVLVYAALALLLLGPPDAFETLLSCAVPILMIWTPEVMGNYTGWGLLHGRPIARRTPAGIVWFAGWFMLLLPPCLILVAMR